MRNFMFALFILCVAPVFVTVSASSVDSADSLSLDGVYKLKPGDLLKSPVFGACDYDHNVKKTVSSLGAVKDVGVLYEERDYVIKYLTGFDGSGLMAVASVYSSHKHDRSCLIDIGYPTFILESVSSVANFSHKESTNTFNKSCIQSRGIVDALKAETSIYKYIGVFDLNKNEYFEKDKITFHLFNVDRRGTGFAESSSTIYYEIYGEVRDTQSNSYWVCKMGIGYKSSLVDAGVKEFQWMVPWVWIFHNPTLSH